MFKKKTDYNKKTDCDARLTGQTVSSTTQLYSISSESMEIARNNLNLAGKLISPENLTIPSITNKSPLTSKPNLTLSSTLNNP